MPSLPVGSLSEAEVAWILRRLGTFDPATGERVKLRLMSDAELEEWLVTLRQGSTLQAEDIIAAKMMMAEVRGERFGAEEVRTYLKSEDANESP